MDTRNETVKSVKLLNKTFRGRSSCAVSDAALREREKRRKFFYIFLNVFRAFLKDRAKQLENGTLQRFAIEKEMQNFTKLS